MWLGLWTESHFLDHSKRLAQAAESSILAIVSGAAVRSDVHLSRQCRNSGRRHQLNVGVFFTETDVSIHVVTAAEPSAIMMLLIAFGGLLLVRRIFGRVKLVLSFGNF
jgi:hypothetical protein